MRPAVRGHEDGVERGKAKRFSLFVPTSDAYASAAARWIGHGALCVPNAGRCLCAAVPDCVHDCLRLREHLRQRAPSTASGRPGEPLRRRRGRPRTKAS
ncbi:hypothetical protein ACP4OV_001334 [Aristida adscensionis]